jgi:hypothetical protein
MSTKKKFEYEIVLSFAGEDRKIAKRLCKILEGKGVKVFYDESDWPAPGSEDTEFGVLMEPEVGHGEAEVYSRVQA